jgi:S1-C subfamily serine protease
MVLTSDGEILTNNHVVNGATSIVVTIASTGKSYRADVVGTDPSDDVAVLQLRSASGLQTANIGDSSGVAVGDDIVGVGNAGGTGTLRASAGTVTALNKSITATDETGSNSEKLKGLIQVHAPIVSGDSGGPLYNSAGQVVGMDTAASANQVSDSTAYAIPINSALAITDRIESGIETTRIHIGLPAFLGVSVNKASGHGALVEGLLSGGPAASAGITSGSVVTKVGDQAVTTPDGLRAALRTYNPGDKTTVTWTTASGSTRTATVTLGTGPAD